MAQQILKVVDGSFKSFFGLLKKAKQGKHALKDCRLPRYLPSDGYTTLVIGFVRLKGNKLILPYSNSFRKTHKAVEITIPPILLDKKVKEIRIIPKADVSGALNIMRKSSVVDVNILYSRGEVDTPIRIRIA